MVKWLLLITVALTPVAALAQQIGSIQKCQDAQGKWYYGSSINAACLSSISTLNQNGIVIQQRNLLYRSTEMEQQAIAEQKASDLKLLRLYSSLHSIEQEYARKVEALRKQQGINLELIEKMDSDIQKIVATENPESQSAVAERESAIRLYQSTYLKLNRQITQLSAKYDGISSNYLQAQSRQNSVNP